MTERDSNKGVLDGQMELDKALDSLGNTTQGFVVWFDKESKEVSRVQIVNGPKEQQKRTPKGARRHHNRRK